MRVVCLRGYRAICYNVSRRVTSQVYASGGPSNRTWLGGISHSSQSKASQSLRSLVLFTGRPIRGRRARPRDAHSTPPSLSIPMLIAVRRLSRNELPTPLSQ